MPLTSQKSESDFQTGDLVMREAIEILKSFAKDEDGAALIEYTVLLGVLVVAVIATIGLVGNWFKVLCASRCSAAGAAASTGCRTSWLCRPRDIMLLHRTTRSKSLAAS